MSRYGHFQPSFGLHYTQMRVIFMTRSMLGLSQEVPTAHQGFLARSESVLVELLYAHASKQNKRLVLCGENPAPVVLLHLQLHCSRLVNKI
jgi:hypothetical protein